MRMQKRFGESRSTSEKKPDDSTNLTWWELSVWPVGVILGLISSVKLIEVLMNSTF